MNLLAFLWLIACVAACVIAFAVPDDVWKSVAERIRNPRPSALEELHRHWETQDRLASGQSGKNPDSAQRDLGAAVTSESTLDTYRP